MYKYNSNFGAGCPNWAVWADLRFGFVHSTDILQKNYDVFCDQETQLLHWWIARKKMFLPRHLLYTYQLSFSLSLYFMIFKNDKMSCQQMHFPMDANWFLLTEGVTHAAASFASAHATWEIPFGFLFQASMLYCCVGALSKFSR